MLEPFALRNLDVLTEFTRGVWRSRRIKKCVLSSLRWQSIASDGGCEFAVQPPFPNLFRFPFIALELRIGNVVGQACEGMNLI